MFDYRRRLILTSVLLEGASKIALHQTATPQNHLLKHFCPSCLLKCCFPSPNPTILSQLMRALSAMLHKRISCFNFCFPLSKQLQSCLFSVTSTAFYSTLQPPFFSGLGRGDWGARREKEITKQFGLTSVQNQIRIVKIRISFKCCFCSPTSLNQTSVFCTLDIAPQENMH